MGEFFTVHKSSLNKMNLNYVDILFMQIIITVFKQSSNQSVVRIPLARAVMAVNHEIVVFRVIMLVYEVFALQTSFVGILSVCLICCRSICLNCVLCNNIKLDFACVNGVIVLLIRSEHHFIPYFSCGLCSLEPFRHNTAQPILTPDFTAFINLLYCSPQI